MSIGEERIQQVTNTVHGMQKLLGSNPGISEMGAAKVLLGSLAKKVELFPVSDFPWPPAGENNIMYCIYKGESGGPALYIDMLLEGESNAPHDHGDSWAMISGIQGQEKHHVYNRIDGGTDEGPAKIEFAGTIRIGPGESVSLLKGGIHSVEAFGTDSVMMLHFYSKAFESQKSRLEYDLSAGTCKYGIGEAGMVVDMQGTKSHDD